MARITAQEEIAVKNAQGITTTIHKGENYDPTVWISTSPINYSAGGSLPKDIASYQQALPAVAPTPTSPSPTSSYASPSLVSAPSTSPITTQQALSNFQSGAWTADQYNKWAATGSYSAPPPPAPPPTGGGTVLNQGQPYMGGTVGFDTATGKPLSPGGTTLATPTTGGATDLNAQLAALQARLATTQSTLSQAQALGYTTQQIQTDPTTGKVIAPTTPTDNQAVLDALKAAAGGTTGGTNYQQQMVDLIKQLTTQQQAYTTTLQNQPTAAQQYQTYREQLGLPAAEAGLTSTNVQIQKTQGLIDQLEKDISSRVSGFGGQPITEAQRRRELAVEQKPLAEQLATLSRTAGIEQTGVQSSRDQLVQLLSLAGADQATQAAIAKAPLEMTQSLLPTLSALLQYQSPEQETAQKVALEKLLKESGLGTYAEKETEPSITDQYGTGIIGEYNFYAKQEKDAGGTPMSFDQYQTADANRKIKIAAAGQQGLNSATLTRIDKVASQFDNELVVKSFNVIAEGYAFAKSIPDNTTSPSDDQGLIYAFAKAMDPNSVVREGEYATVQKYAESWAQAYGFKAARIFANVQFLTASARKNMKNTIKAKYTASLANYSNVYNEYLRRISAAGATTATDFITDYRKAFPNISGSSVSGGTTSSLDTVKAQYAGQNAFFFKTPSGEIDVELNLSTSALQNLLNQGYVRI